MARWIGSKQPNREQPVSRQGREDRQDASERPGPLGELGALCERKSFRFGHVERSRDISAPSQRPSCGTKPRSLDSARDDSRAAYCLRGTRLLSRFLAKDAKAAKTHRNGPALLANLAPFARGSRSVPVMSSEVETSRPHPNGHPAGPSRDPSTPLGMTAVQPMLAWHAAPVACGSEDPRGTGAPRYEGHFWLHPIADAPARLLWPDWLKRLRGGGRITIITNQTRGGSRSDAGGARGTRREARQGRPRESIEAGMRCAAGAAGGRRRAG